MAKADFSDTDGRVCSEKVGQQPQNNTGAQQQQVADDQDHPVHNCETAGIPESTSTSRLCPKDMEKNDHSPAHSRFLTTAVEEVYVLR